MAAESPNESESEGRAMAHLRASDSKAAPSVTTQVSTSPLSPTERTRLRRYPQRGRTDRAELYDILDAGMICYLGTVTDGYPRVLPMAYGRIGDTLYIHGSVKNQALQAAANGTEICVTIINIHGLVLANTLFHHSVNFSSAMIYGKTRVVTDLNEKIAALQATGNQLIPGRADALPAPTPEQFRPTLVLALSLEEASLKVREGGPLGELEDYERDIWAGVLPLQQVFGEPLTDPELRDGIPVPDHVSRLVGTHVLERRMPGDPSSVPTNGNDGRIRLRSTCVGPAGPE